MPAKDAVMGIFEELIDKVKQHDIKQFRSWVYVLSRNYCLMQLRSAKKWRWLSLDEVMEFTLVLHPDDDNREEAMKRFGTLHGKVTAAAKTKHRLVLFKREVL